MARSSSWLAASGHGRLALIYGLESLSGLFWDSGGVFLSYTALTQKAGDLSDMVSILIPMMLAGLAAALSIVGAIVGLIIRMVS